MKFRTFLLLAVFVMFTVYTAWVVANHGYTGFFDLALAGGWGAQVFIDLCIALLMFMAWMIPDARERGIPFAPYVVAIFTTGSVGALAYLVHRTLRPSTAAAPRASVSTQRSM